MSCIFSTFFWELETQTNQWISLEKTSASMFKLLLPFSVYADSQQQIQSSTPSPSNCFFFQISLKLCGFFMFLSRFWRTRNSFRQSPTFNNHVRFTLFASSSSHPPPPTHPAHQVILNENYWGGQIYSHRISRWKDSWSAEGGFNRQTGLSSTSHHQQTRETTCHPGIV